VKCSVLLPVYNGAATLRQAMDSVLAQTDGDFEFLAIDDKSKDDSAAIIRDYMRRDARVIAIFHEENQGLASTLNEGLERARAGLVVRMDQDDECLPDRIRLQVRYMGVRPDVAAAGSHVYHMAKHRKFDHFVRVPVEHDEIMRVLPSWNCMYHPATILRKAAVLEVGGYRADFKNAEDYELWLRLAGKYQLGNLNVPLLRYRFSIEGMTLSKKWQQFLYANMAMLSYAQPGLSREELERAARGRIESIGKEEFFEGVARGTIQELAQLRLWADAIKVYLKFVSQLTPVRSARLLGHLSRSIYKSLREAPYR
jgi:glycosyltransferase involved in cell wall biosynthesis